MPQFEVISPSKPQGDQPEAIDKLVRGVNEGRRFQTLMGVTGSGKTFAAFLSSIDRLFTQALARELEDQTQVLYVSPLKALSNDIQKNLRQPLAEIGQAALQAGLLMPELRVLVRTGDTPMADRQQMLKRPPHILVTTPESLFILLTAEKSRRLLQTVRLFQGLARTKSEGSYV